jgi:DNA-binding winged helix-turn-helix (wHTH) protein
VSWLATARATATRCVPAAPPLPDTPAAAGAAQGVRWRVEAVPCAPQQPRPAAPHRAPLRPAAAAAQQQRQLAAGAAPWAAAAWLAALRRAQAAARPTRLAFAGARLDPADRTLCRGAKKISLAPREAQLAELLARSPAEVVTYEALYAEILGRPFRGDTGNLRVLLGKLCAAAARAGLDARAWIEVIPKSGYRLRRAAPRAGGTP